MSIPKKGSRILVIDGKRYRWRVRHRPTYMQALAQNNMMLAVESADTANGAVLLMDLGSPHASNWLALPGASVTPAMVSQMIQRAITSGWNPDRAGDQFHLDVDHATDPNVA